MSDHQGTLRPVRQTDLDRVDALEAIGDTTISLGYELIEPENIFVTTQDEPTALPFVDGVHGWALYDQAGQLVTWWALMAPRGKHLMLPGGWSFPAPGAVKRHHETTAR